MPVAVFQKTILLQDTIILAFQGVQIVEGLFFHIGLI